MNAYAKCFDKNRKCMNLWIKDEEVLKKYNEIWNTICRLLKKDLIVNQCIMINALKQE